MIAVVDMNCFFAQIEQQDYPYWRNKAVGVTDGNLVAPSSRRRTRPEVMV